MFQKIKKAFKNFNKNKELEDKQYCEMEERKIQIAMNKLQLEQLKRMQLQKDFDLAKSRIIDEYSDEDDAEETEEDENTEIASLLGNIFSKAIPSQNEKNIANTQINSSLMGQNPVRELTDDDIRSYIVKQSRKKIIAAKSLPKGLITRRLISEGLTENETERAYKMLIEEF